jgi:hypothetical protein
MVDAEDSLIKEFAARLRDRKLYKCVDVRSRISHEFDPESTGEDGRLSKIETCCAKANTKLIEWSQANSSDRQRVLIDEAKRSPYNDAVGAKGPIERINVRTDGGNFIDLKKRSRVVANLTDFMLFRAYHDRDDEDASGTIDNIINGEVEACR